jgi:hypothetical protein
MNGTKRGSSANLLLILACLAAGCGGKTDDRPVSWSYISTAIIQPSCATANCHSKLSQRSGVELDTIPIGYHNLVDVTNRFVVAGRPDDSALLSLLKGQGNRRMPPDFALPNDDITLISNWIMAGATNDGPAN